MMESSMEMLWEPQLGQEMETNLVREWDYSLVSWLVKQLEQGLVSEKEHKWGLLLGR